MVQHSIESIFEVVINASTGRLSVILATRRDKSRIGVRSLDIHSVERRQVEESGQWRDCFLRLLDCNITQHNM